ncbi:MAG: SufS family cysteine desulfurase [Bacteroidales bacterium]
MDRISEELRKEFPILSKTVYGKPLVYFDNAATSQKPQAVIDMIHTMTMTNANVHRAVHKLSADCTDYYEAGRIAVKNFINAKSRSEVIFTSGTTASINLVASSFSEKYLKEGDEVLVSQAEHHSNLVPWQIVCKKKGASLKFLPIDNNGQWRMDLLESYLTEKVKIVAMNHISNVLGVINPIKDLIKKAHKHNIPVLIDGAQGIVHGKIDVQDLDCDFYVFSGHKLYAATGTGILYGKEKLLEDLPVYMGGGDMVNTVKFSGTTYADLPLKFEAGTPNFIAGATWTPAIEMALKVIDSKVASRVDVMTDYLNKSLSKIDGIKIYGKSEHKIPLFSFSVKGVHHQDIAMLMDKMGVAVRSGLMCAEPLINHFGETGLVRASLLPYNTLEECEIFMNSLKRAIRMLR